MEGRCGFFVKRKQRYCKMKPTKGTTFCAEHAQHDGQVGLKISVPFIIHNVPSDFWRENW